MRGEDSVHGTKRGNGGAAAESDKILQPRIIPQTRDLRNIAADARTQIARASADHERIDSVRPHSRLFQRRGKGLCAEGWRRLPKFLVEFVGIHTEEPVDIPHGKLSTIDAGIATQDGRQKQTRAAFKLAV